MVDQLDVAEQLKSAPFISSNIRRRAAEEIDNLRAELLELRSQKPYCEFAEQVGMPEHSCKPACMVKKAQPTIQLGNYGQAYDMPGTKRAFTYSAQPGNREAHVLGRALEDAKRQKAGDSIDAGLNLLKSLQKNGFGVFQLDDAERTTPDKPSPRADSLQLLQQFLELNRYRLILFGDMWSLWETKSERIGDPSYEDLVCRGETLSQLREVIMLGDSPAKAPGMGTEIGALKTVHLALLTKLMSAVRISIRDNNMFVRHWSELEAAGLVTILRSGRLDTLVIHPTRTGEAAHAEMLELLREYGGAKAKPGGGIGPLSALLKGVKVVRNEHLPDDMIVVSSRVFDAIPESFLPAKEKPSTAKQVRCRCEEDEDLDPQAVDCRCGIGQCENGHVY